MARIVGNGWEVRGLDLTPPRDHEVLIRFVAAGLCHSDGHLRTGDLPNVPWIPGDRHS